MQDTGLMFLETEVDDADVLSFAEMVDDLRKEYT